MKYDHNVVTMSNKSRFEVINQRQTNQVTTKACVDHTTPKPVWQLAFCELAHTQICFVVLVVDVSAGGNADGGRHAKLFDC
jgi:hypothetical protein